MSPRMTTPNPIQAKVDATSETIVAELTDRRTDSVDVFQLLTADQQRQLALDAWCIGLRALKNANAQAQEARLADIGKTLKEDLSGALNHMVQQHQERVETSLRRYFDPNDGELSRRLERFIEDDGELSRLMARFVSPDGSVIAETLAKHVGEQSVLIKKLSPSDADGVVQTLKQLLTSAMAQSSSELQQALDPLRKDSPVSRFLYALRDDVKKAEADRSQQMVTAFKALDANDPNSLLSNLARQTQNASQSLLSAMNPANKNSPLAYIQASLMDLLERHMKRSHDILQEQQQRQEKFEKDIRDVVTRLETQRLANRSSPRGGEQFEDLVLAIVQERVNGGPYVCTKTGNVVGIRDACKVGDFVVRFTEESAWAGAAIVFECKHDASYHVDKAIKELDIARTNREAAVGVFVMAQSHASSDFPAFSRIGQNILVTWDSEDCSTLPRLYAAVMLAMALASRKKQVEQSASTDAVRGIETMLTEQLSHVEKIRKASESIRKSNDVIRKELDKSEAELKDLVEKAHETLRALDIGCDNEANDRKEPIAFGAANDNTAA